MAPGHAAHAQGSKDRVLRARYTYSAPGSHHSRLLGVLILVSTAFQPAMARAGSCSQTTTVGLDTTYANSGGDIDEGRASGQTFLAIQTEIQAITVWRVASQVGNVSVWHIFIMGLDSLGIPNNNLIIQDGPTLAFPDSGPPHRTPFRFVFDPPVVLPGPGEYEFAIQGDHCAWYFDIAANCGDGQDYPDGIYWSHGRETYCYGYPRLDPTPNPNCDLVFEIEFCQPDTGRRSTSWGQIKALYR